MIKYIYSIVLCVLVVVFPASLYANRQCQEVGVSFSASSNEEVVETKFTCLYWEGRPKEALYCKVKKKFKAIRFRAASRSQQYEYVGPRLFTLYRRIPPTAEAEERFVALASTPIWYKTELKVAATILAFLWTGKFDTTSEIWKKE